MNKTKSDKKIVCLGGGVGTVNLIKGLKEYTENITVVVSMADDGGSAGRLRRFYRIPPPGDIINSIAAMSAAEPILKQLLLYRFAGDRYGADYSLPGHKLGNLIFTALISITGDFNKALEQMHIIFKAVGRILPSTVENISIWAKTSVGEKVYREENIDLGRFTGKIERLYLKPSKPSVPSAVIQAINDAEVIIAGPGDLYTTILPTLLVPEIIAAIKKARARKLFVVNVANKSFETPSYSITDYVNAIIKHCKTKVFDTFLVNNNSKSVIPPMYRQQYEYVSNFDAAEKNNFEVITADLVNQDFPIYHDSKKLARVIWEHI